MSQGQNCLSGDICFQNMVPCFMSPHKKLLIGAPLVWKGLLGSVQEVWTTAHMGQGFHLALVSVIMSSGVPL